jgi:hypothetical protein
LRATSDKQPHLQKYLWRTNEIDNNLLTMPKFVVTVNGVNFLIRDPDAADPVPSGFYVNVYIEEARPEGVEGSAVELVRTSPKLRAVVANSPEDPPRMFVTEIAELTDWPADHSRPLSGFIYYDDPDAEWRERYPEV